MKTDPVQNHARRPTPTPLTGHTAGRCLFFALIPLLGTCTGPAAVSLSPAPKLVKSEFIFATGSVAFESCHASTLAETKGHLVAAWFGGSGEGHPDVSIWLSRFENGAWTAPSEVVDGKQAEGSRLPCWNPVLFQPRTGPLLLFFKVGPSPSKWWGMLSSSGDGGVTWSRPRRLPEGILGPIKNKPVEPAGDEILCPSSTEHHGWQVHFERTRDRGLTWESTPALNDGRKLAAIQPSILSYADGRLQAVGRTRQGRVFQIWSRDNGRTWGEMTLTALPNPNSGIDAVTLKDGRQLLVYNHTTTGRTPLNVALSRDGKDWQQTLVLEHDPGEYSYPAVIQTHDGLVHITYTWKRVCIKHVALDPATLRDPGGEAK